MNENTEKNYDEMSEMIEDSKTANMTGFFFIVFLAVLLMVISIYSAVTSQK